MAKDDLEPKTEVIAETDNYLRLAGRRARW